MATPTTRSGPTNSLVDVAGMRVGQLTRNEPGWLTGVTVVVCPGTGVVGGVDVRGGGPGTRETDLLDPRNAVDKVNAIVLAGGSAFGLAAADGVVQGLYADGLGWPVGGPGEVVPIVPAAILFDLGRGGDFGNTPTAADGLAAYRAARDDLIELGSVGAGTGARAGGHRGGVGSASVVLDSGATVAALVVINAIGATVDPTTGRLYAAALGLDGEFPRDHLLAEPQDQPPATSGTATTLAVVATDATLTKAQCQKFAGISHDGLARAVKPVHTMFDGDTVFALATGAQPAPDGFALAMLMEAGADTVARAIGHAMLAADAPHTGSSSQTAD